MVLAGLLLPGVAAAQSNRDDLAEELRRLERRIAELEAARAAYEDSTRTQEAERLELLQRIEQLERARSAQENAVRAIIGDALSSSGSKINDVVLFGGTFEFVAGTAKDFSGVRDRFSVLNTAEFDFEIVPNDWVLSKIVLEYTDGLESIFTTIEDREVAVDRINIDTATLMLGNPELWFPTVTAGRAILPFGISTGEPVADVLTIEDPLTIEVFEMRRDAVEFAVDFPTPEPKPLVPVKSPPPVRPRVLNPLFGWLARALGYDPAPKRPPEETYVLEPTPPPPVTLGVYHFTGLTTPQKPRHGWRPHEHWGATAGFRTSGPFSFELDLDYNSSIFDSRFLAFEYGSFLDEIGLIQGLAANIKANLGPVPVVVEWNGATEKARFVDDADRTVDMQPNAWQISVGYQFDWNRWMPASGAEGTYVAVGFSQSHDLAGATRDTAGQLERVGFVPRSRFLAHVAEWIYDGTRIAFEYEYVVDYGKAAGGTGREADAFFTTLTFEW